MTRKAKQALEGAILHWWENYNAALGCPEYITTSAYNCPLCDEYIEKSCDGCPVSKKTKLTNCSETPYNDVRRTFTNTNLQSAKARDALLSLIAKEIEFLESLRDYPHKGW